MHATAVCLLRVRQLEAIQSALHPCDSSSRDAMIDKHFILQSTIAHGAMTEQAQHAQAKSNAAAANDDTQDPVLQAAQELQMKAMMLVSGAMTVNLIGLGDELGFYKALKAHFGPMTPSELAKATDTHERWTREWLYQQAAAGFVTADDEAKRFHLSAVQQIVLTNEYGPDASHMFSAGFIRAAAEAIRGSPLKDGFKTGRGWSYDDMADQTGGGAVCGTCRSLGTWIRHFLIKRLAEHMPEMHKKLQAGIKVADVGCGAGEALLTLAAAYPNSTFHGYDIAQQSLDSAASRQEEKGLGHVNMAWLNPSKPGGGLPGEPTYDMMLTVDAVHDMARPDQVLPLVRKAIKPEGGWLVFDMRSNPTAAENLRDPQVAMLAPTLYGFSVHVCLPSGLSEEGGLGLGTLGWNESVARQMTADVGFARFEVLNFEHPLNSTYWIQP